MHCSSQTTLVLGTLQGANAGHVIQYGYRLSPLKGSNASYIYVYIVYVYSFSPITPSVSTGEYTCSSERFVCTSGKSAVCGVSPVKTESYSHALATWML